MALIIGFSLIGFMVVAGICLDIIREINKRAGLRLVPAELKLQRRNH